MDLAAAISFRERVPVKPESFPNLYFRALSTERERRDTSQRSSAIPPMYDHRKFLHRMKRTSSIGSDRSSRNSVVSQNESLTKLYDRVNASLTGELNNPLLNIENIMNKNKHFESEKRNKITKLSSLTIADTFDNFLEPYTKDFMEAVEQSQSEIDSKLKDITEDMLSEFQINQASIYTVVKKVLEDCLVKKLMSRHGIEEIGKAIVSVIDKLVTKYMKVVNTCKAQMTAKNVISQHKEQQALILTRNEKMLFESIKYINLLHNPLFEFQEDMKETWINNLVKCKQTLRENKTNIRIDVVNNFEEDIKKLNYMFHEIKSSNEILTQENKKLKDLIDEINSRYSEDHKLIKLQNAQLAKQKEQKNEKSSSTARSEIPKEKILITQQTEDTDDRNEANTSRILNEVDHSTIRSSRLSGDGFGTIRNGLKFKDGKITGKNSESQIFVIAYLQKEQKYLEAELLKAKNEVDKLKNEKIAVLKRNQELEDLVQEKQAKFKDVAIQCVFSSDKEGYIEVDSSTIDRIFEGKDLLRMTSVLQDEEWLLYMVNMLFQEKFQADLMDDYEGRPRKSLKAYCKEWFLNKFGYQQAAEALLRDFLRTLAHYAPKHPRYKTFGMLIGIPEAYDLKLPDSLSMIKDDSGIVLEYFKRQFLMSHYGSSIFNKVVLLAKTSKCAAEFDTFLPEINSNADEDSLEIKGLLVVLREILTLLNIPLDEVKQILGQFDLMVQGDKYFKLVSKQFNKEDGKEALNDEIEDGLSIRMDYFIQFVLENTGLYFVKEIERLYTQVKLTNEFVNNANLSVDLYKDAFMNLQIERPARWLDVTFETMMQKDVKHGPPLFQIFGLIAPYAIYRPPQTGKIKLPEDGYPLFQVPVSSIYLEKDVITRVRKSLDVEANFKLLKLTYLIVKMSLSKHQKRVGNVDYLNDLLEKDMNNIKTAIVNLKLTQRQSEKEKVKHSLEQNWRRLRAIIKIKYFVPKEQGQEL